MPVAQRLLDTTDRALPAGRVRQLARRAVAHEDTRQDRGLRDDVRAHAKAGVSHGLADRHRLSQERAVAIAGRVCPTARRRPAIASRGCGSSCDAGRPGRGSVREVRRSRLRPVRVRPTLPAEQAAFGALVRVHAIPADPANDAELARAGIPQPSFYLVRPDGHVGLCGGRFDADAVRRYLSEALRCA